MTALTKHKLYAIMLGALLLTACKSGSDRTGDMSQASSPREKELSTNTAPQEQAPATSPPATTPPPAQPVVRELLITIDDLPLADFSREKSARARLEIVERLTTTLKKEDVPFVAFLNMEQNAKDKALLPLWQGTRAEFGNHTWSHPHPRKVGTEKYLEDLRRGHEAVAKLTGEREGKMPFRYPYLYEGFPCEQREAIRETLRALDARNVPVTIDGWDWYYSRRRQSALDDGDAERAKLLEGAYMGSLKEATLEAEWYSEELFGRQPPQVLLLHGNTLVADMLPEMLAFFRARGYRFVTLKDVWADPAYAEVDHTATARGFSHWKRLMRSRDGQGVCPANSPEE